MLDLLAFGDAGWGDEMLRGAGMTVLVAVLAYSLGIVIGTGAAAAKLSRSRIPRGIAEGYTTVVRGVPELLVIYLFFFGSSGAVMVFARQFGYTGYIEVDNFIVGVLAVGLISGAYSTEVMRGAILAIPKGQIEAGRAVGMHGGLIFRRIMLPQLLRLALPGLGNVWQLTLKDTALISVTALAELMRMASVAAGSTRQPFLFYITAALLYLLMTTVSQAAFQRAERRFGRGVRRAPERMDVTLMANSVLRLLGGAVLTLELVGLSLFVGFFAAIGLALMRLSHNWLLSGFAYGYVFVFRGTPLLVQMFLIYFGLGQFAVIRESLLWPFLRQAYWCAILAMTLNTAAYTAELFRGGIQSVPWGQIEAARACGMSQLQVFFRIVLPIALRQALPAYGNEVILMVKASSLASTITLMEITGIAKNLIARTFAPIEIFIVAGAIYLAINFIATHAIKALEWRLTPYLRPRQ